MAKKQRGMIAIHNHWYKCQEGQMPEDFENCLVPNERWTENVIVAYEDNGLDVADRMRSNSGNWRWMHSNDKDTIFLAWMLPSPYVEQ